MHGTAGKAQQEGTAERKVVEVVREEGGDVKARYAEVLLERLSKEDDLDKIREMADRLEKLMGG